MGIFEFIWRILDNVAWIIRTDSPWEIANAITNIFNLFLDNLGLFG